MPRVDVAVVGAGLAGLACAAALAERGASVALVAKGMASTHWTHGGLDLAAPAGARDAGAGRDALARRAGHPYAVVGADLDAAVEDHLGRLNRAGLPYLGALDAPFVPVPTPVGSLRPASVLPEAQAAALAPWNGDGLLLVGYGRYRDAWAPYAARNLASMDWPGGPREVRAVDVELPRLGDLHNLNPRQLALLFERSEWRRPALDAIAEAIPPGAWRVGLPATLGITDHRAVLEEARTALEHPVLEIPSLPPSIPGLRLFGALRATILRAGGRVQIGNPVAHVERAGDRVVAVHTVAAARTLRVQAELFVLATGGIGGEGIRARPDGTLVERVFDLPVAAPPREEWFSDDPLVAHPLEAAGIATDADLRPVDARGAPVLANVRVIGSALAGMHYLGERCGDGVALASAHRVARAATEARLAA